MSDIEKACDAVSKLVSDFVTNYEFYGEDESGRDGTYTPTEPEKHLIEDAINGLLSDEVFVATFCHWQDLVRKVAPNIEARAIWERGRQMGRGGAMAGDNPYAPWNGERT